jgi:enoyl-CoA hydratase/carnithine racemase
VVDQIYQTLTYGEEGHCRIVSLSFKADAEAAALQVSEVAEVCDRIAWDETARVVVIAFDGAMSERLSVEPVRNGEVRRPSLVEPVAKLKLPVIAAIRGDATDFALELALACDIRIGTEDSHFGFPQIRDGRIPCHGGTQRLPRLIGLSKAMQVILTGELMDALEANRAGLLNRIVPSGMLIDAAMQLALEMAERSPLSLSYAKEALYSGMDLTLDQGLRSELDLYLLLFTTSDRTEGVMAFKERRRPEFDGS